VTQPSVIQLENRSSTLTVGTPGRPGTGIQITNIGLQQGLDIWFQVRRSLKAKEPNTCDLRIRNLSNASRKALESATTGTVSAITSAPSPPSRSSCKPAMSAARASSSPASSGAPRPRPTGPTP